MPKLILFVCTENSARSQMAEAFFNSINRDPGYAAASAGLKAASSIKPLAVEAMLERGMDMSGQRPKKLTPKMADGAHRIITMGCQKSCPAVPPEKTSEWKLDDPSGKPIQAYREVRDEIERRIRELVRGL
jgi:arsenate reductase (thioredoxin)